MNKVLLVGRISSDIKPLTTNSGIKYIFFSVAVTRKYNRDETDFIPMVAWRQTAEYIEKYLSKGARISVEGSFQSSEYKDANGNNVTSYRVQVESVEPLETKAEAEKRVRNVSSNSNPINNANNVAFEKEANKSQPKSENQKEDDIPWDLDI